MSGIFLSHSSKDKHLVIKLAIDLANRGFPVWFDSWELETGDSMYDRVFNGIDESSFLLVALSKNSINSKWVGKELNEALAKEDRLGRKVILPIMLSDCEVPLSIADRLYADFSLGWLRALENLESILRKYGANHSNVPFERQIVPLVISKGLYLERTSLQARYEHLIPALKAGEKVDRTQIVIAPDENFEEMANHLRTTIETLETNPKYSPEIEQYFHTIYDQVCKLESALIDGVVDIANGLIEMNEWAYFAEASHWYVRLVRSEILYRFREAWEFSGLGNAPLGQGTLGNAMSMNIKTAKFYDIGKVMSCDVFRRETNEYFKVWIDQESEVGRWFNENPQLPDSLHAFWSPNLIYQFVVPQMVFRHRYNSQSSKKLAWDLSSWLIGLA